VQLEHELPVPATGAKFPSIPFEKEENREKVLFAVCWHFVQVASSSLLLTGRISSNLQLQ